MEGVKEESRVDKVVCTRRELDKDFIQRFHIILQVMSCGYNVNVEKFNKYCHDTAKICVDKFPWYYMSTTVHKVLIHGAQIIESAVLPIGQLFEDAQEARNKDIKKYREGFSRKNLCTSTMENVFHWLLVSSDPLISSLRKIIPKQSKNLSSEALELLLFPDDDESENFLDIYDKHDNYPDSDCDSF